MIVDRIPTHGKTVGAAKRLGDVVQVREHGGTVTLAVRFDDGHEDILASATDCEIVHATDYNDAEPARTTVGCGRNSRGRHRLLGGRQAEGPSRGG